VSAQPRSPGARHLGMPWFVSADLIHASKLCSTSLSVPFEQACLVRAEGLEPSRALRPNGFSYPATAFAAPALGGRVWGLDYPFTVPVFPGVRCCPSSLYTFPSLSGRAWLGIAILQGSPNLSSSASPVSRRALKFLA